MYFSGSLRPKGIFAAVLIVAIFWSVRFWDRQSQIAESSFTPPRSFTPRKQANSAAASLPLPTANPAPAETESLEAYQERVRQMQPDVFVKEFVRLIESRKGFGDFGYDLPYSDRPPAAVGGDPFIRALLLAWGERAPQQALDFLPAFESKSQDVVNRYIDVILAGWSHVDAPSAWNWGVQSAQDFRAARGTYGFDFAILRVTAVGMEMVKQGRFAEAAAFTATDDEHSGLFAKHLATEWAKVDASATAAWILTLPEMRSSSPERPNLPLTRAIAMGGLSAAIADGEREAVRSMISISSDPITKRTMASSAIRVFGQNQGNPLESLKWFVTVVNENPVGLFSGTMRVYAQVNPKRFEPGTPEAATEVLLINSIVDEKTRAEMQQILFAAPARREQDGK